MYGAYLTAKIEARKHGDVERLMLTQGAADVLAADPRHIQDKWDESDPIFYGMAGDFEVYPGAGENAVVTDNGTRVPFNG